MRITSLRLSRFQVPFRQPYATSAGTATHREGVLVQVGTDTGVSGLGESSWLPHEARNAAELFRALADMAGRMIGADAGELRQRPRLVAPQAWAGVDTAIWDASARADGLPLSRFVSDGQTSRRPAGTTRPAKPVAVNALVTAPITPDAVDAALRAISEGYTTVKLKVGVVPSAGKEVERVKAVRRALPRDCKLRLDANGAWDETTAVTVLSAIHSLDIEYVEQPVAPGNLGALARIRQAGARIAADEDVVDLDTARRVIEASAADVLVLKPIALGGVQPALLVAQEARDAGIEVAITTSIDTGVGTALALQLAAVLRSPFAAGLATAHLLESDLLAESLSVADGCMALPGVPGLGVVLGPDWQRYVVEERTWPSA
jgi:o-succinylbenzoate synthase